MNLQKIYLKQLIKSPLFLFTFSLTFLINIGCFVGLYYINNNYYSVLYYLIIVLLVTMFIKLLLLVTYVSLNNIRNNLDFYFITKSVSKNSIFWNKFSIILIIELCSVIINSIISVIIFASLNANNSEIATIFLMTFFGEILLSLFFIPLLILISYRIGFLKAVMTMLILPILIISTSVISHLFLTDKSNSLKYNNNQQYQYQRFVEIDQNNKVVDNYVGIKKNLQISDFKENLDSNFKYSITKTNQASNFILTDWFLSPFYTIAKNNLDYSTNDSIMYELNNNGYSGSLIRYKLNETRLQNKDSSIYKYANSNFNDKNIFVLNSSELVEEVVLTINNISNLNSVIDLNNEMEVNSLKSKLENTNLWVVEQFSQKEINTILNLYGYSEDFGTLYYLYKNIDMFNSYVPTLFDDISKSTNNAIGELIKFLYTNNIAIWNMEIYQPFINQKEVSNLYSNLKVYDKYSKPNTNDIEFLKSVYVVFNNSNKFKVLQQDGSYVDYDVTLLNNIDINNVTTSEQWIEYVDTNIINLADLQNLVENIQSLDTTKIYQFVPTYNVYDINSYSIFYKPELIGYLESTDTLFSLYFVFMPLNLVLCWYFSKEKDFK